MSTRVMLACGVEVEQALRRALQHGGEFAVAARLGAAPTIPGPLAADVLVVDVESLGTVALDIIGRVMQMDPLPILALCPPEGTECGAIQALVGGAVEAIPRDGALAGDGEQLRQRVRVVSGVSVARRSEPHPAPKPPPAGRSVVAIAASTGGPAALATVLGGLAGLAAPVLLVQHLHEDFMAGFVEWLGGRSALPVSQATHGQPVEAGHVHVAPGGRHLRLGPDRTLTLNRLPTTVHRPSADELFDSVAGAAGAAGIGVLLTGMGADGAAGLLTMRKAGARTFIQDEGTCVVFGMPKAALAMGAADHGHPLDALAEAVLTATRRTPR